MEVQRTYSHKGGECALQTHHAQELNEVYAAVESCDAVWCLRKITKESTKHPLLFSPPAMNLMLKRNLHPLGWTEPARTSRKGFREPRITFGRGRFREMDGIKNKVGLEIQFGKYAFMGYDVFSKMPIFAKRGLIECGIELVAMHSVVKEMSSGVSFFDQIVLDMENRGEADLDIPTVVIGIGLTQAEVLACERKRERFLTHRDEMLAAGEVSLGNKGASPGPKGRKFEYEEGDEENTESEQS